MLRSRDRRAARAAVLTGFVAFGCVYPHLSTSSGWSADDDDTDAGAPGSGGNGGTPVAGSGGKSGGGGTAGSGGDDTSPIGGDGGSAPNADLIHGLVADQYDNPVAGVVVLIDDVELASDEDGEFSLADSGKKTFDVTVVDPPNKVAYVYQGITRRELRVSVSSAPDDSWNHATAAGTVESEQAVEHLAIAFRDPKRGFDAGGVRNPTDVSPTVRFSLETQWGGADTVSGKLMAMNWTVEPVQNLPDAYTFAALDFSLKDGDEKSNVALELAPLKTRQVIMAVSPAPGVTRFDALIFGTFVVSSNAPNTTQAYRIPDDPAFAAADLAAFFSVSCSAPGGTASFLVPITAELDTFEQTCGSFAKIVSPAAAATGVTNDTPLSFEPELEGCHSFSITHQQPGWSVFILSTATEVVPPDLSKWGLSYATHDVSWTAGTSSPCESIDDFLAPIDRSLPPARLTSVTTSNRSAGSTFTTAQ